LITCYKCGETKPLSEFVPSAPLWPERNHWCRPCDRARVRLVRHGMTVEQRNEIAIAQGGCRICGHPEPSAKGWVVDHDHECCPGGKSCPKCRRGIICQWCNTVLGNAFDRPEILRAAAAYLEADRTCDWHMPLACDPRICDGAERASSTYVRTHSLTERVVTSEIDLSVNNAREVSKASASLAATRTARYAAEPA